MHINMPKWLLRSIPIHIILRIQIQIHVFNVLLDAPNAPAQGVPLVVRPTINTELYAHRRVRMDIMK